jgi:hypothetical protein
MRESSVPDLRKSLLQIRIQEAQLFTDPDPKCAFDTFVTVKTNIPQNRSKNNYFLNFKRNNGHFLKFLLVFNI